MSTAKSRILIVDDSAVIRAILTRTLELDNAIEIAGIAHNGEEAVKAAAGLQPDIVILDIEMPVMDGLTALPFILKAKPGVMVLICSTLSSRGADISMRALALGATDCLLKPGGDTITTAHDFQTNLLRVIHGLIAPKHIPPLPYIKPAMRPSTPPRVLAIGSSTGGPNALEEVLRDLKNLPVPIVITQHMPKAFTTLLAHNLEQNCGLPCVEGENGMALKPGTAYIAPGGIHMTFGFGRIIHLDDGPPENYCKPSVDTMLRSLIKIYSGQIQVAILTGMGADGLEGCRAIVEHGGEVIAQNAATSVVWGMPGAVANAGLCSAVLPLQKISPWLRHTIIPAGSTDAP